MTPFSFLDNIEKMQEIKVKLLNIFENIMENFPQYFQIHDISKASKGVIME